MTSSLVRKFQQPFQQWSGFSFYKKKEPRRVLKTICLFVLLGEVVDVERAAHAAVAEGKIHRRYFQRRVRGSQSLPSHHVDEYFSAEPVLSFHHAHVWKTCAWLNRFTWLRRSLIRAHYPLEQSSGEMFTLFLLHVLPGESRFLLGAPEGRVFFHVVPVLTDTQ